MTGSVLLALFWGGWMLSDMEPLDACILIVAIVLLSRLHSSATRGRSLGHKAGV